MDDARLPSRSIGTRELSILLSGWREALPGAPGYVALATRLRTLVLDGRLPVHSRLPSERELASLSGASRTTTTAAYKALRDGGFADGRQGSGTWTTLPGRSSGSPNSASRLGAPGRSGANPWPATGGDGDIDPADLSVAAPEAPPELYGAYASALAEMPRYLPGTGYVSTGLPDLRKRVADRYTARGLPTSPEQILVTAGAAQAIRLVMSALVRAGDRVLFEHPTWPMAVTSARTAGGRPLPVSADPGWEPDTIRTALRQGAPRVAYLMPDAHNPTGRTLLGPNRGRIAALLADAGCLTIVDETLAELDLRAEFGRAAPALPPFAAASRPGAVITIGSASKTLWGGLRIGWVRAEPSLISRLVVAKAQSDLACPVLEQLTVAHLFDGLEPLLDRRRAEFAERCRSLRAGLRRRLPSWTVPEPDGGLVLWCQLPEPRSTALTQAAGALGVTLAAGPRFGVDGGFESRLRLPFSRPIGELDAALDRVAQAWSQTWSGARSEAWPRAGSDAWPKAGSEAGPEAWPKAGSEGGSVAGSGARRGPEPGAGPNPQGSLLEPV